MKSFMSKRTGLVLFVFICNFFCLMGCGATEAIKMNAAIIKDELVEIDKKGTAPGTPVTKQLVKMAGTNENFTGSPKTRLAIGDVEAQEKNRVQAEADVKAGGLWEIIADNVVASVSVASIAIGLPIVGVWLKRLNNQRKLLTKKVKDNGNQALVASQKFEVVVNGIRKFAERVKGETGLTPNTAVADLKASISKAAADSPIPKADFDKAVKTVLAGGELVKPDDA